MYQGHPLLLEAQKPEFVKILDKWEQIKAGIYRYDIVIEGDKMYITVIETSHSKELKEKDTLIEEQNNKIVELDQEVEDLQDLSSGQKLDDFIEQQESGT